MPVPLPLSLPFFQKNKHRGTENTETLRETCNNFSITAMEHYSENNAPKGQAAKRGRKLRPGSIVIEWHILPRLAAMPMSRGLQDIRNIAKRLCVLCASVFIFLKKGARARNQFFIRGVYKYTLAIFRVLRHNFL